MFEGKQIAHSDINGYSELDAMSLSTLELEGLLAGETREIIKRLLAERKPAGVMSLNDIAQMVLRAGEQFEAMLTEALIEAEEADQKGERPICPECGGGMRHRGYREKKLVAQTGEVGVRRRYYPCTDCGRGFFPPG
jgi:uncharacterized protein with PIN domain